MAVATDTRAVGEAAAIAIGGTVGLDAMFGGPITGASMNPARSLGPAIAGGDSPRSGSTSRRRFVGAAAAAVTYRCLRADERRRREPRPLRLHPERRPKPDGPGPLRARRRRRTSARSAGSRPAEHVHPEVVDAMGGARHRPSGRIPHRLDDEDMRWADVVVTMGCGDECPYIPGKRYIDWELDDPPAAAQDVRRDPRRDRPPGRRAGWRSSSGAAPRAGGAAPHSSGLSGVAAAGTARHTVVRSARHSPRRRVDRDRTWVR